MLGTSCEQSLSQTHSDTAESIRILSKVMYGASKWKEEKKYIIKQEKKKKKKKKKKNKNKKKKKKKKRSYKCEGWWDYGNKYIGINTKWKRRKRTSVKQPNNTWERKQPNNTWERETKGN